MKTKIATFLAATLLSVSAFAAYANLVNQHYGTSVTGQSIVICVYQYNGQHFEKYLPVGSSCPTSIDVR